MEGKLRTHLFVAGNCANEKSALNKSIVSVYCDDDDDDPDTRAGVILSSRLILTAMARPTPEYWCQVVIEDDIAPTHRYIRESWETLHFQDEINDYPWSSPQLQILVLYSPMVLTIGKFNDHEVAKPMLYGKNPTYKDGDVCTAHTIIEKKDRELDLKVTYQVTMMSDEDCQKIYEDMDDDVKCITMNDCDTHCEDLLPGSAVVCNDDLVAIVSEHHNCDNKKPRACAEIISARSWISNILQNASYASSSCRIVELINFRIVLSLNVFVITNLKNY
uniref:Peptidase S1 domain-containing protein n=1 Tax=Glossina morsitans morsitans TaxID=37546 RepID=A0A1B0G9H3_GLOMM